MTGTASDSHNERKGHFYDPNIYNWTHILNILLERLNYVLKHKIDFQLI